MSNHPSYELGFKVDWRRSQRWKFAALWSLRLVVCLQCLGAALFALQYESPLATIMFMRWGWPEATVTHIDQYLACVVAAAGILCFIYPVWYFATPVGVYFLLQSAALYDVGGQPMYHLVWGDNAIQIALPFILAALRPRLRDPFPQTHKTRLLMLLLRLAVGIAFITQGIEALRLHPHFVDTIIIIYDRCLMETISQHKAEVLLRVIGAVDLVIGAVMIVGRWRPVAFVLVFWGTVVALSAVIYTRSLGIHTMLEQSALALAPFTLFCYWQSKQHLPDDVTYHVYEED